MEKRTQQGKLTNLEIASFCSEMAMILKSGISSLEGVDLLREDAQTKAEKELLDEIYPVSYTHLDVYKRQFQHLPAFVFI